MKGDGRWALGIGRWTMGDVNKIYLLEEGDGVEKLEMSPSGFEEASH
jgi:hypothetical protein